MITTFGSLFVHLGTVAAFVPLSLIAKNIWIADKNVTSGILLGFSGFMAPFSIAGVIFFLIDLLVQQFPSIASFKLPVFGILSVISSVC